MAEQTGNQATRPLDQTPGIPQMRAGGPALSVAEGMHAPQGSQPVLKVEPEIRGPTCKPGESVVFKVPIRNVGLQPLKLLRAGPTQESPTLAATRMGRPRQPENPSPSEAVRINPDYVKEVPPGGLVVLRCQVAAPMQPGVFSRRLRIETDAPDHPAAEVSLTAIVPDK